MVGALVGRRILVVEDEALVAMLIEDALAEVGALTLGPAASVAEALALLEAATPSAAVLDLNLAGENSLAVADRLVAAGVPFVIATGYGRDGVPARHAGVVVLPKPYDPTELIRTLGRLFG